jgi:hypothetical protein
LIDDVRIHDDATSTARIAADAELPVDPEARTDVTPVLAVPGPAGITAQITGWAGPGSNAP